MHSLYAQLIPDTTNNLIAPDQHRNNDQADNRFVASELVAQYPASWMREQLMRYMVIRNFSFGGAAAIVTSMSLIIGFDAITATKTTILAGLLIVALADNLTDSLSMHIYQESERLEPRKAFHVTMTNFATRLGISLSFVVLVLLLPMRTAVLASLGWGVLLLVGLTYLVAMDRKLQVLPEVLKHLTAAAVVILTSKAIGHVIVAGID